MLDIALHKKLHSVEGDMQLDFAITIKTGQFVSLYGPSGAGKTSILRMLAGLMKPDNGHVETSNSTWFNSAEKINIPPQQRNIGLVFQDYALFPNMNVRENVAFALTKKDDALVDELLQLTGISALTHRNVNTLSGGQQQRVALARAIAKKPSLLLLDEPLSAIDNSMRRQLQDTLLAVHKRFSLTTILVSHNMDEIIRLSERVIHLEGGIIKADTTPALLFGNQQPLGGLHGQVTAIAGNANLPTITILLDARMLTLQAGNTGDVKVGDKVLVDFNDGLPHITKTAY